MVSQRDQRWAWKEQVEQVLAAAGVQREQEAGIAREAAETSPEAVAAAVVVAAAGVTIEGVVDGAYAAVANVADVVVAVANAVAVADDEGEEDGVSAAAAAAAGATIAANVVVDDDDASAAQ